MLDRSIPAGRLVRLAVQRYLDDLERFDFDQAAAQTVLDCFPLLKLTTGEYALQSFQLRPWQQFIVWNLFGWKRPDGTRRYRDALISVARGNGKSPLAAALAVWLAFLDGEYRAEVYCWATKKDQAKIVFEECQRMVENGPLRKRLRTRVGHITNPRDHSIIKPLGSDSKNTDGLIPHGCILDELHEWREQHRGLWDKIETSLAKRPQCLAVKITTAGNSFSDLWLEQYRYSCAVLDQTAAPPANGEYFGDEHFAFIAEVDKEDDIFDEANWPKASPMLLSPQSPVKLDPLRVMAARAAAGDRAAEIRFRRYYCNQMTEGIEQAFTRETWAKGDQPLIPSDAPVYLGLDLARSNDFAAVSLVQPLPTDPVQYNVQTWAWTVETPGEMLSGSNDFARLRDRNPQLRVLPGEQITFAAIRDDLLALAREYQVRVIAYDDTFARETAQYLTDEHGLPLVAFPQNAKKYNEPTRRFSHELSQGRIRHGGDDLLAWQACNLLMKTNTLDQQMPDKARHDRKIDSMVALYMAFSECLFAQKQPAYDFYEHHRLESF